MCEANVYTIKGDKEELFMESIETAKYMGNDSWMFINLFGEQKEIKGKIKRMNLVDHKILFEPHMI
jgi:predicted RNA-binding protein